MKSESQSRSCPCHRDQLYHQCCGPLHAGAAIAESAERLMRSRYSAYVLKNEAYLLKTWHATTRPDHLDLSGDQDEWLALEVLSHQPTNMTRAHVHFVAYFKQARQIYTLEERSRFTQEGGAWLYIDGDCQVRSLKRGRNEPCICSSGKKLKRCCGR